MANPKGSANISNLMHNGKNYLLPPKSPFPCITPSYTEYGPNASLGSKSATKCRDGSAFHQRTSSESLIEEQPSWLDELLNEPDTPVRKGHRRSSSDSFAYFDAGNMLNADYMSISQDESRFQSVTSSPLWGSQNLDLRKDTHQGSLYHDPKFFGKPKNRPLELKVAPMNHTSGICSSRDNVVNQSMGVSSAPLEMNPISSIGAEKQGHSELGSHDLKTSEKKDGSHAKTPSDNDTKRAKQQFAQRSRVRKLQYIAELERNVQALQANIIWKLLFHTLVFVLLLEERQWSHKLTVLYIVTYAILQAEGSEVSAELEFLNQQNLILSMENKALKQRLDNLAQEKLIKYLEHEVLEKEMSRLRALYQQQQQPQQQQPHQRLSSSHRRKNSRDLDAQFANLSLKHKEAGTGADSFSGPVRI